MFFSKVFKNWSKCCPLEKIQYFEFENSVVVKPQNLFNTLLFFKYHILNQFEVLTYITAVDYPSKFFRFKLVYDLLSLRYNCRIKIKTFVHELFAIESCSYLFLSGGWYECEVWDFFGIFFKNHPNLKRILTDYGFEGYPLRKDFPLSGFIELRYYEFQKRVMYESIELSQEYRTFDFFSPWGIQKIY